MDSNFYKTELHKDERHMPEMRQAHSPSMALSAAWINGQSGHSSLQMGVSNAWKSNWISPDHGAR